MPYRHYTYVTIVLPVADCLFTPDRLNLSTSQSEIKVTPGRKRKRGDDSSYIQESSSNRGFSTTSRYAPLSRLEYVNVTKPQSKGSGIVCHPVKSSDVAWTVEKLGETVTVSEKRCFVCTLKGL